MCESEQARTGMHPVVAKAAPTSLEVQIRDEKSRHSPGLTRT